MEMDVINASVNTMTFWYGWACGGATVSAVVLACLVFHAWYTNRHVYKASL